MGFNDEYSSQLTVEWPISNSTWKSTKKRSVCENPVRNALDFCFFQRQLDLCGGIFFTIHYTRPGNLT